MWGLIGIPQREQCLCVFGRLLAGDTNTLASLGIADGSVLDLSIGAASGGKGGSKRKRETGATQHGVSIGPDPPALSVIDVAGAPDQDGSRKLRPLASRAGSGATSSAAPPFLPAAEPVAPPPPPRRLPLVPAAVSPGVLCSPPKHGSNNMKNDCFANSGLMALAQAQPLLEAHKAHRTGCTAGAHGNVCVDCAWHDHLVWQCTGRWSPANTDVPFVREIIKHVGITHGAQYDVAEFTEKLLEAAGAGVRKLFQRRCARYYGPFPPSDTGETPPARFDEGCNLIWVIPLSGPKATFESLLEQTTATDVLPLNCGSGDSLTKKNVATKLLPVALPQIIVAQISRSVIKVVRSSIYDADGTLLLDLQAISDILCSDPTSRIVTDAIDPEGVPGKAALYLQRTSTHRNDTPVELPLRVDFGMYCHLGPAQVAAARSKGASGLDGELRVVQMFQRVGVMLHEGTPSCGHCTSDCTDAAGGHTVYSDAKEILQAPGNAVDAVKAYVAVYVAEQPDVIDAIAAAMGDAPPVLSGTVRADLNAAPVALVAEKTWRLATGLPQELEAIRASAAAVKAAAAEAAAAEAADADAAAAAGRFWCCGVA